MKILVDIAKVLGLGGFAVATCFFIFRDIIRAKLLAKFDSVQSYKIINRIISLIFLLAVLGLATWAIVTWLELNSQHPLVNSAPFEEALKRGEAALASENYTAAATFFKQAEQLEPDNWIPYDGLGRVNFNRGNFALALNNFLKAFDLSGKKDGSIIYSVALTQDALSHFDQELESLNLAANLLGNDSPLASDVSYDQGAVNLILWMNSDAPKETRHYEDAEAAFQSFIEGPGEPKHWAYYHLACLKAIRAQDASLSSDQISNLKNSATNLLEEAVQGLANYNSVKAPIQRQIFQQLLLNPEDYIRKPGGPISCPTLVKLWSDKNGPVEKLAKRL